MERFGLKKYLILSIILCCCGKALHAEEAKKQYYLEKLSLASTPQKACIYKVYKGSKVVEECGSIGFKLGAGEESTENVKYVYLHPLSSDELPNVKMIWTMFYLENDILVSTKLRPPLQDRLVGDGMLSVLESEQIALESQIKQVELELGTLNSEISKLLSSRSGESLVSNIYSTYLARRENKFLNLMNSRVENVSVQSKHSGKDIRGELSNQLKDIMEGRVR